MRIAGSSGVLVIGSYFVELADIGFPITSVLVGAVTGLLYLSELLLAPCAGAMSDRGGRKGFLLAGPLLAAFAVLLPPLGFLALGLPSMGVVVGLLVLSRLIERLGGAISVPATFRRGDGHLLVEVEDLPASLLLGRLDQGCTTSGAFSGSTGCIPAWISSLSCPLHPMTYPDYRKGKSVGWLHPQRLGQQPQGRALPLNRKAQTEIYVTRRVNPGKTSGS